MGATIHLETHQTPPLAEPLGNALPAHEFPPLGPISFDTAQRALDLAASGTTLMLLWPLLLAVAALIRATSPGPALHRAERVGRAGRPFVLLKFRSMVAEAARLGPGITRTGDPRITPLGRILRRTKLDELPQLINVLRGEMSLVGPRPEDPRYVALYTADQRRVLTVRPGITSPASVDFRLEEALLAGDHWEATYVSVVMPQKLALELDYLARRSFWSDLGVLVQTVGALLR